MTGAQQGTTPTLYTARFARTHSLGTRGEIDALGFIALTCADPCLSTIHSTYCFPYLRKSFYM